MRRVVRLTAPNLLTLSRFLFAPVVFLLILLNHDYLAFAFYTAGALTDALDGYLARKLRKKSKVGGFLDAFADRVFAVVVVAALIIAHKLTSFAEILFVFWLVGEAIVGILLTRKIHKFYLSEVHRNSIRIAAVFTFSTIGAIIINLPLPYLNILIVLALTTGAYAFVDYLKFIFKR